MSGPGLASGSGLQGDGVDALKVMSLLQRRPDLALPAFSEYWRTIHKAHAMTLVEAGYLRGYIQNHRVDTQLDGFTWMADGAPELWIDDVAALQRLVTSQEYLQGAGPDEANFTVPPVVACVARERVLREVAAAGLPDTAVKVILVFRRGKQVGVQDFAARWMAQQVPVLMPTAVPLRLTRYVAVEDAGEPPFDAIECSWWDSLDTFAREWARRDVDGGQDLVEPSAPRGMVVREEVVVPAGWYARARGE